MTSGFQASYYTYPYRWFLVHRFMFLMSQDSSTLIRGISRNAPFMTPILQPIQHPLLLNLTCLNLFKKICAVCHPYGLSDSGRNKKWQTHKIWNYCLLLRNRFLCQTLVGRYQIYDVVCVVWCLWSGVVYCGVFGVVWCFVVWWGVVLFCVVLCVVVWCGVVLKNCYSLFLVIFCEEM